MQVARDLAGGVEVQPGLVGRLMGVGAIGVADQLGRIAGRRVVRAIGQLDEDLAIESVLHDDGVAGQLLATPARAQRGHDHLVQRHGRISHQVQRHQPLGNDACGIERGILTHALQTVAVDGGGADPVVGPALAQGARLGAAGRAVELVEGQAHGELAYAGLDVLVGIEEMAARHVDWVGDQFLDRPTWSAC